MCQYVKRLDQGIRVQLGGMNYDVVRQRMASVWAISRAFLTSAPHDMP